MPVPPMEGKKKAPLDQAKGVRALLKKESLRLAEIK